MLSPILPQKNDAESSDFALVFRPPTGGLILSLEQLKKTDCNSHGRPLIKATHHGSGRAVLFRPRCKLWSCPTCGQINARRVVALAAHGSELLLSRGLPLDFVTVTSHEKLNPAATVRILPSAWSKLRMRLAYAAGSPEYLVIPEQHSDGRLHLHLVVTAEQGTRWWKDNARQCGMGYQAEDKPVKSVAGVVGYTAGYMAKTLQFSNWAKGFRRYRTTQGWPKLPELPEPDGWNFTLLQADHVLNEEIDHLMQLNYVVAVLDHATAWKFVNSTPDK